MARSVLRTADALRAAFKTVHVALDSKASVQAKQLSNGLKRQREAGLVPTLEGEPPTEDKSSKQEVVAHRNEDSSQAYEPTISRVDFQEDLAYSPSDASSALRGSSTNSTQEQLLSVPLQKDSSVEKQDFRHLRASAVPSSRIGRLVQYGGLALSLGWGSAQASFSRATTSQGRKSAGILNEPNVSRLVKALSKMRGAALKIGQFLSIQDTNALSPELRTILSRVQDQADYMPIWQMEQVLTTELGQDWRQHFQKFEDTPFAAASIGQVHRGMLHDGRSVAVKVQFPGIEQSIDSDLGYLKTLLAMSALLPRGLFLDNSVRVLSRELKQECDYEREGKAYTRFRQLLKDDVDFQVPEVIEELSSKKVLTVEMMEGTSLARLSGITQKTRDEIGERILKLCLREVFEFRLMQTDPNWSNFLWHAETRKLQLIDFGASQSYSRDFVRCYKDMLIAAVHRDHSGCVAASRRAGFLIDDDDAEMIRAHVASAFALGQPFRTTSHNFANDQISATVRQEISTILHHRRSPPPEASYSLNRKLSGCFLLCTHLGSRVACQKIFADVVQGNKAASIL